MPGVIPKALGKQELLCYLGFFFTVSLLKNSRPQTGRSVWCLPGASAHPWDKQPNISIAPVCFQAILPGSAPRLLQVSHILLLLLHSPGSSLTLISHLPRSQVGALPPLLSPCHPRDSHTADWDCLPSEMLDFGKSPPPSPV